MLEIGPNDNYDLSSGNQGDSKCDEPKVSIRDCVEDYVVDSHISTQHVNRGDLIYIRSFFRDHFSEIDLDQIEDRFFHDL